MEKNECCNLKLRPLFDGWRKTPKERTFFLPKIFALFTLNLTLSRETKNNPPPKPKAKQTNKQKKITFFFFFNWIGQTQGLLLKKKEERKEKWLPHPSVLICAYLMINNTLWSIVWCGLCWFEQENTESLLRHLWITSVYSETINERGRLKKKQKKPPKYAEFFE